MSLHLSLALVPLLIGLNAFFVGAEYAVVTAKALHVETLRTKRRTRAADALDSLTKDPAGAIGTIQVCITMTNLLLGWIGEPAMSAVLYKAFGPLIDAWPKTFTTIATALSFLVVTLLTVVFSELLPKALTLRYVVPVATLTAVPIVFIRGGVRPLVVLMNALANAVTVPLGLGRVDEPETQVVSSDEVRLMAAQAADAGALSPRERTLVLNSLTIGRRRASEIMVPRVKIAHLNLQRSMDENLGVVNEHLFSRFPLCDGSMDKVIGVVYAKDFLTAFHEGGDSSVLQLIAAPAAFAPHNVSLDALLGLFHECGTNVAFLVEEYGGVEGMVTLQDVVNELLGGRTERADAS